MNGSAFYCFSQRFYLLVINELTFDPESSFNLFDAGTAAIP